MIKHKKIYTFVCRFCCAVLFMLTGLYPLTTMGQPTDRRVTIHLRGVYDASIIVMSMQKKTGKFLPIIEQPAIKSGTTSVITIPAKELPGQFTFQFKYRQKESDYPYPSERILFVYEQDIELFINPPYGNNPDSTRFAAGELENTMYEKFMMENSDKKKQISLLQMFLIQYDDVESDFYNQGEREYEKRRTDYNNWISNTSSYFSKLYVCRFFQFQHIPPFEFKGTEKDRTQSMIDNYFEGIDLSDSLIAGIKDFNDWLTNYINLNAGLYTNQEESDTMLVKAAQKMVEHGKKYGHPKVYGFIVDYFYTGFEMYNMLNGIKMLEPYSNDPSCLTTKRIEINRRLAGMESLKPGVRVPEIKGRMQPVTHSACMILMALPIKTSSCSGQPIAIIAWN